MKGPLQSVGDALGVLAWIALVCIAAYVWFKSTNADSTDGSIPGTGPLDYVNRLFGGHLSAGDVSVGDNVDRWGELLFGSGDDDSGDDSPAVNYNGITPGSVPPDELAQVQGAVNEFAADTQNGVSGSDVLDWAWGKKLF